MAWVEGLKVSSHFLVLGTRNYLESLRNNEGPIIAQISMARQLDKPVILLLERSLSDGEVKELKGYLLGMRISGEVSFSKDDLTLEAAHKIKQIIDGDLKRRNSYQEDPGFNKVG